VLALVTLGQCYGQNFDLTEKFTLQDETATARSMGLAGAFGSVGADFSAATNNPAGIALFRKSELGLSLGYNDLSVDADFLDGNNPNLENKLSLNSIGGVYSQVFADYYGDSIVVRKTGLVNFTVAAGMNQRKDVREQIEFSGFNDINSLTTSLVRSANQFGRVGIADLDEFERQAFRTGLLDTTILNDGSLNYDSFLNAGGIEQSGTIDRTGVHRTYYVSGGANFSNKLYVGATLGLPTLNYEETKTFTETDSQGTFADFTDFSQVDERTYDAVGAYFHAGAIYRANDFVRVGLNIKSPTVFSIEETTEISTVANYATITRNSDSGTFNNTYDLTTPWQAGGALVLMHPQYGLLSFEGDFINYASSRISFQDDQGAFEDREEQFKDNVQEFYGSTFNLRAGAEVKAGDFRLRGGYAINGSPYENEENQFGADYERKVIGAGIGYRLAPANITVDLGYNQITSGEFNSAYVLGSFANDIILDRTDQQFRLSLSKRF